MKTGTKILLAGAGLATLYLLSREATGSSHQYFISKDETGNTVAKDSNNNIIISNNNSSIVINYIIGRNYLNTETEITEITFDDNIYDTSDSILIASYTKLTNPKIRLAANTNVPILKQKYSNVRNIEIENGLFDGNNTQNTTGTDGLFFDSVSNSTFINTTIQNCSRDGLVLDIGCQNNTINSCTTKYNIHPLYNDGDGMVNRGINNNFNNCISNNNKGDGFILKSDNSNYTNCISSYNGYAGFSITTENITRLTVSNNTLTNCTSNNNRIGFIFDAISTNLTTVLDNNKLIDGLANNNLGDGIRLEDNSAHLNKNTELKVQSLNNTNSGIWSNIYNSYIIQDSTIRYNNIGTEIYSNGLGKIYRSIVTNNILSDLQLRNATIELCYNTIGTTDKDISSIINTTNNCY